jgi:hypothetical protein
MLLLRRHESFLYIITALSSYSKDICHQFGHLRMGFTVWDDYWFSNHNDTGNQNGDEICRGRHLM